MLLLLQEAYADLFAVALAWVKSRTIGGIEVRVVRQRTSSNPACGAIVYFLN